MALLLLADRIFEIMLLYYSFSDVILFIAVKFGTLLKLQIFHIRTKQ